MKKKEEKKGKMMVKISSKQRKPACALTMCQWEWRLSAALSEYISHF